MKKVSLIISAVLLSAFLSASFADNSKGEAPKTINISGTVTDQNSQEALAGALIKIEGTEIEVYTDLDGKFSINGIVPDTYKIKCTMISYNDREEEVELEKTTNDLEIRLMNYVAE
jgi:outer membrane receptor for ferrienterochelin and colicins